jgi:Trk K+ transport system NAD-binding subunit
LKKKILIIGFGNIGFRHVESILNKKYLIYIVDPKKNYFDKISKTKKKCEIKYFNNIKKIDIKNFDLLISATSSDVRYITTVNAIRRFNIKNIIFEKVVFTNKSQFFDIKKILEKNKIKSWVNCPLRNMEVFKNIKKIYKKKDKLIIKVKGTNWNMASNTIHYLDLFNFFDKAKFNSFENKLKKQIYHSKRNGFFELHGVMKFIKNKKKYLMVEDCENSKQLRIIIEFNSYLFILKIGKKSNNLISYFKDKLIKRNSFIIHNQSSMTSKVVSKILQKKSPGLISYSESLNLHMIFLDIIDNHLINNLKTIKNYPIT